MGAYNVAANSCTLEPLNTPNKRTGGRYRQVVWRLRQRAQQLQRLVVPAARPQQRHQLAVPPHRRQRSAARLRCGEQGVTWGKG